jgi:hypothetical protein
MVSMRVLTPPEYYTGNRTKEHEMGVACSTYGGGERYIQDSDEGELETKKGPTIEWRDNIQLDLEDRLGKRGLDQSTCDKWRALVNTVMKLHVP